jgi:indole-3-glycerol phosphate synthase
MPANLFEIVSATRQRLGAAKEGAEVRALEQLAQSHRPRGFRQALQDRTRKGIAIIAELKKASPSRGLIRSDFHADRLARELEAAGAAALSVLTDEQFFQGSLENLRKASAGTSLPCLRKDFIIDDFQLLEARANCADAVLLIVAALSQAELVKLAARAAALQLDVLCEVHDEEELRRAVDAGCDVIGVNNRDLRTFRVDLDTAFRLSNLLPKGCIRVLESGIRRAAEITRLQAAGYEAFLIGEWLMGSASPGEALRLLLAEAGAPTTSSRL